MKHFEKIWHWFVLFCVHRGGFGLWLDADLYHGSSFSCPTFHNKSLSTQEDFVVQDLEVWTVKNWEKDPTFLSWVIEFLDMYMWFSHCCTNPDVATVCAPGSD